MRKRSLSTEEAIHELARQLRIPRAEIGVAGRKDRDAVTVQRISVPERAAAAIERFEHAQIQLWDPKPHSHKLRRGHLRANQFRIVVRELDVALDEAQRRAQLAIEELTRVGLRNYYGVQRFGAGARNLEPGLAALAGRGRRRPKGDIQVSAGQSALLNLYLATRAERSLLSTALRGDILQKRETGGMFECEDPSADQARLDAGELVVTGPMFGSKMRAPSPGTPAATLEREILDVAGIAPAKLAKLGRKVPGTRRRLLVWPDWPLDPAVAVTDERGDGLRLCFALPSGSYATVLIRELCGQASVLPHDARASTSSGARQKPR